VKARPCGLALGRIYNHSGNTGVIIVMVDGFAEHDERVCVIDVVNARDTWKMKKERSRLLCVNSKRNSCTFSNVAESMTQLAKWPTLVWERHVDTPRAATRPKNFCLSRNSEALLEYMFFLESHSH
jgi:hypothetical protein